MSVSGIHRLCPNKFRIESTNMMLGPSSNWSSENHPEKPIRPKEPGLHLLYEDGRELPEKPKPPPGRLIREGGFDFYPFGFPLCKECGSTTVGTFWGLGKQLGCIQPECSNYYRPKPKVSKLKWLRVFFRELLK